MVKKIYLLAEMIWSWSIMVDFSCDLLSLSYVAACTVSINNLIWIQYDDHSQ